MKPRERRRFFNPRFVRTERRRSTRRWAAMLVLSIPLFLLFERYVTSAGRVTDVSMLPALKAGDYFFINKFSHRVAGLARGDVVVLRLPEKRRWRYVKRVVGLPGETLSLSGGRVWINGEPLSEPYVRGETHPEMGPIRIPAGFCFVLGDNRPDSQDSRQFGLVPLEQVEGKIRPGRWFTLI